MTHPDSPYRVILDVPRAAARVARAMANVEITITSPPPCPECKGARGAQVFCGNRLWDTPIYRWVTCHVCKGARP